MKRRLTRLPLSIVTSLIFMAGCGDTVILDGTGTLCVSESAGWPSGAQTFEEGAPVHVTVRFADCLSSSCATDRAASCTVILQGDRLLVEAEGSYVDESGAGRSCTSDCLALDARCQTAGPLPAGSYTVVYGDLSLPLVIPSLTGNYCVPTPR